MSSILISRAVEFLRNGGLVAFPTETVYGLGADARNAAGVRRVFLAKGRPSTNPLIVHVADIRRARRYSADWPDAAEVLARSFWPGPLTLVLPKTDDIVSEVSAGGATIGLRSPDHRLALELLDKFDGPLAGPSANRSTRISPTTAMHVREELGDRVDFVLDGGACRVGIESTVLDLTLPLPKILRPGAITRPQIERLIGPVELFEGITPTSVPAASPGQQETHYSPHAVTYRFQRHELARIEGWSNAHPDDRWAIAWLGNIPEAARNLEANPRGSGKVLPDDAPEYARRLYGALRDLDQAGIGAIFIEMPQDTVLWLAVRDRLNRATQALPR